LKQIKARKIENSEQFRSYKYVQLAKIESMWKILEKIWNSSNQKSPKNLEIFCQNYYSKVKINFFNQKNKIRIAKIRNIPDYWSFQ